MAKVARSLLIVQRKAMPDTPSAPRRACSRRPANGTRTRWRTKQQHLFRMSPISPFRTRKHQHSELADFIYLVWLGREDSNLRMVESKSTALPLGDAPTDCLESRGTTSLPAESLSATPVYRG